MPFLAILAWLIGQAPHEIGHIIAELLPNVFHCRRRIFHRIMQPGGREQRRLFDAIATQRRHHPCEVLLVEIATTIILAGMRAPRELRSSSFEVIHIVFARSLRLGGPTMKNVRFKFRNLLAAAVLAATVVLPARAEGQVVSGAVGAIGGIGAGGYVTLAVVVLRAQYGHYLHDAEDLLGWNSVPVLLGAATGTAVGVWDADRMVTGFAYGAGGALIGGTIGYLIGPKIWKRPEGKWAGGAIGAGAGMAAGYFFGVFNPQKGIAPGFLGNSDKAVIPINVTISVP